MAKLRLAYLSFALCALVACSESESDESDKAGPRDGGLPLDLDASRSIDGAIIKPGNGDASAGDGGDRGTSASAALKLPCDIDRIVSAKCGTCHGEDPVTRISLTTASDFQAVSADKRAMFSTAKAKINAVDSRDRMPPVSNDPLTPQELATLNAWLDQNAPAGSEACAKTTPPPLDGVVNVEDDPNLTCYKFLAHNGDGKTPLALGVARDVYYAYVFAAPWKETVYGMVVRSVIDNKKVLHHWTLYQDNLPGIPSGAVPQIGAHPTGQLLAVWAPGGTPMDLRNVAKDKGGVGLELPATTTYTVEFHYNSDDVNAVDHSGLEVCVAKQRPANIAAYSWLGKDQLAIPSTHWQGTCLPFTSVPINIISFMPHMHLQGIHMKGTVNRYGGSPEVVHDAEFNFNFQKSYPVNVVMNPGDSLTVDCHYAQPSVFGQPTDMEMCYLFALAYPKGALASPDLWGTIAHGSSSCLGQ